MNGTKTILADGSEIWLRNELSHRTDGPAERWTDGTLRWAQNNEYHREDGPAVVYPDGRVFWYLNGVMMSKEDHTVEIQKIQISQTIQNQPFNRLPIDLLNELT